MFTTHPDDMDTFGPRLWDADPDVCCAAYQLGACAHSEADSEGYDVPRLVTESTDLVTGVVTRTYEYTDGERFTIEDHPQPTNVVTADEPF